MTATTLDIKTMQEAATAEALRAVQSAAARWWSLEDIALQMRLSKSHVAQQIVCQPGFPTPVPRSKQPRWVARDVVAWFEGE